MWDEGRDPPAPFFEQPEIRPDLQHYWMAFHDLGTERQIGMGVGPIPRSRLLDYAHDDLGLDGDDLDRFCAVIRMMDDEYVAMANGGSKDRDRGSPAARVDDPKAVMAVFGQVERKVARRRAKQGNAP